MADRRNFLRGGLVAASAFVLGSVVDTNAMNAPSYTNILYTAANPGRWKAKVASHLPSITVNGRWVTLFTKHPMSGNHHIVKHTLVLQNGSVAGTTIFDPSHKKAESRYELPQGYRGKIFGTSFCNLHDFWLNESTV